MLKFLVKTDQGDYKVEGLNHGEARDQIDERFAYNVTIYSIEEIKEPEPKKPEPVNELPKLPKSKR